jgi:hypothetical protein
MRRVFTLGALCLVALLSISAVSGATSFNFQGRLLHDGAPATGQYDLRFILYTADIGGSQVGDILLRDDVEVAAGVFDVSLDFGAVFTAPRFIEVHVRPGASTGSYQILNPRKQIEAAPFALSVPWSGITGMPAGFADGVDNDTQYTAGHGLQLSGTQFSVVAPVDIYGAISGRTGAVLSAQADDGQMALRLGSTTGHGLLSQSNSGNAVTASSSSGRALSGVSSTGNGLYAQSTDAPAIFALAAGDSAAGRFQGNVQITGSLTKSSGTFQIDHPLDPANKYLFHSFIESPEMLNVYNGNVTTDGEGRAVVALPAYFEALNTDFRYQLTVMGQFAQAIVAEKIEDNRFVILTDKPNVEVSWQVTGVRNDAYARAHRVQVEVEKAAQDRGKYLHPIELGFSPSLQIGEQPQVAEAPLLP